MEGSLDAERRRDGRLRGTAIGLLLLLAAQNLLGLFLNLYVAVNDTTEYEGVISSMFASTSGALHVVLAVLLLAATAAMIVIAWPTRSIALRGAGLVALVSLVVASYSGFHFVASQEPLYSFTMEVGFLGMVLSAAAVLFVLSAHRPPTSGPSPKVPAGS